MKVRKSIFETNSSSTHSLVICDKDKFEPVKIKGEITIYPSEFAEISSWYVKASYLYTGVLSERDSAEKKADKIKMIKKVIEDFTGAKVNFDELKQVNVKFGGAIADYNVWDWEEVIEEDYDENYDEVEMDKYNKHVKNDTPEELAKYKDQMLYDAIKSFIFGDAYIDLADFNG